MDKSFLFKKITDTIKMDKLEFFVKDYFNTFKDENPLLSDCYFRSFALFLNCIKSNYAIRILVKNMNRYYLIDENLKPVLADYKSITPMFKNDNIPEFAKNEFSVSVPMNMDTPLLSGYAEVQAKYLLALHSHLDIFSSLYLIEASDGCYGIANCDGRIIVPTLYSNITVLPLKQDLLSNRPFKRNLFLWVCKKDQDNINKTDVYDTFGNLLYCNIADISINDSTINFSRLSETESLKAYPVALKTNSICIKKAKKENGDLSEENIISRIITTDLFLSNNARRYPMKPNFTPCFISEWVHIPSNIKLRNIKENLLKMSTPFAKRFNKNVKEIMLYIPFWNIYRQKDPLIPNLTDSLTISDIKGISIRTHNVLKRAGCETVRDIINLNIDDIRSTLGFCKRVEDEIELLKYRLMISIIE